jgi:hypothetical protein
MTTCEKCKKNFELPEAFVGLFEKLHPVIGGTKHVIPYPTCCPNCRYQRRLSHRNEWNLYRRKCSGTGRQIISIYSEDKPFTVFAQDYWWSDKWDARSYARDFDFKRPFFEQFAELQRDVPRVAVTNTNSENSEFTNQCCDNKDCYLCACTSFCEKVFYGYWNQSCRECLDCYAIDRCELCCECLNSSNLYHCAYVIDSESCSNSWFSSDCRSCSYVFGSHGLRNKSFYWFNESVTENEWHARFNAIRFVHDTINALQIKSSEISKNLPKKFYHGKMNESFSGDYVFNSKNTFSSFNCKDCWDVWYSQDAWRMKDSSDITEVLDTERCYEIEGAIAAFSGWIMKSWPIDNSFYCELCFQSSNLFGCVGLRNAKYCVFNKQYSEAEYYELVSRLIAHMRETGEWGEYFPAENSPFGYNETVANSYFPLTKAEVRQKGWRWHDELKAVSATGVTAAALGTIGEVTDDILKQVILCEESGQPFKIIAQELAFYRKMGLPIPCRSPATRRLARLALRNRRELRKGRCMNLAARHSDRDESGRCLVEFDTSFPQDCTGKVYCEECYLNEAY